MDIVNPFAPILQEIRELRKDVVELRNRIPVEKSIRRYSIQYLAENTPFSEQWYRAAIKKGLIKADRVGRKYMVTEEEFNRICKEAKSLKYQRQ